MATAAPINETRLMELVGTVLDDVGAAMNASLFLIGDRLNLYTILANTGPATSAEFAERTGTDERYIREWLSAQAAAGYVAYDPTTSRFSMEPEQVAIFADEDSPVYLAPAAELVMSVTRDEERVREAFLTGDGVGWDERDGCLFCGTARFFRTAYKQHLIQDWIPALDGMVEKLERGATVADIGCGHGVSTITMAEAFPNSRFFGFDYHQESIDDARKLAEEHGVADRVTFEAFTAKTFPGDGFDLVCFFDCLHDMGDPVGALRHTLDRLAPDGTVLIVEPFAHDRLEDNLNPVGQVYYAASAMICTPASRAQEVGLALGAQAGESRLRDVATEAGFTRFRRAAETPFNLVLEARP